MAGGTGRLSALIGVVFAAAAVGFAASSSWYDAFLAIHVATVVIWVGAGAGLVLLAALAERQSDPAELVRIVRDTAAVGQHLFVPAGVLVVVMGFAMAINDHLEFEEFWLAFGIAGFAVAFLVGVAYLVPLARETAEAAASRGPEAPETRALLDRTLLVSRAYVALLLLVVVDMVTKPFSG